MWGVYARNLGLPRRSSPASQAGHEKRGFRESSTRHAAFLQLNAKSDQIVFFSHSVLEFRLPLPGLFFVILPAPPAPEAAEYQEHSPPHPRAFQVADEHRIVSDNTQHQPYPGQELNDFLL